MTPDKVEKIVKDFQLFHETLKVPDDLLSNYKDFEMYVRDCEDEWLRTTLEARDQATLAAIREVVAELKNKYQNDPLAIAAGMEDIKLNAVEDFEEAITKLLSPNQ